jgi:16S rRNA (adenine1518-N6/adenine1519-N6)-dimethyltransferase
MLKDNLKEYNNIEIIFGDFLNANVIEDIKKYSYKKLYVVANLPYYITTPIILKLIEDKIMPDKIVVMVQKEVGDRFKAKPGTKDYSSLSVYLNYYFSITKLMDISRNVFMPRPNVDSIVVEFKKINNNIELKDKDVFFKLVRDSFVQKRKTLRNNLKNYDLNKIEEVLKKHNFDLSVRAEQLSIEIFAEISNNL